MPKFIGRNINGSVQIRNNANEVEGQRVRLTYSQAVRLPREKVMCSLNTSDRGGPKSLAKRWYNWFASPDTILTCPASTPKMRARAENAQPSVFQDKSTRQ